MPIPGGGPISSGPISSLPGGGTTVWETDNATASVAMQEAAFRVTQATAQASATVTGQSAPCRISLAADKASAAISMQSCGFGVSAATAHGSVAVTPQAAAYRVSLATDMAGITVSMQEARIRLNTGNIGPRILMVAERRTHETRGDQRSAEIGRSPRLFRAPNSPRTFEVPESQDTFVEH